MNMKKIILIITGALLLASCDSFLDVVPDRRVELDDDDKITKLLVNVYPSYTFALMTEMMSDNYDDLGTDVAPSYNRLQDEMWHWEDIKETGTESPKGIWESYYAAIATANTALEAIEKQGNPARLNGQRGEALISRAYNHFCLVNVFSKHYSIANGETDLGIPYVREVETTVKPHYDRESVAAVYRKMEEDIEEALPLIRDDIYTAPKYHFNRRAAYAFAARFNLYYRKYDKVIEYSNVVLGVDPSRVLRDYSTLNNIEKNIVNIAIEYVKPEQNTNLLLITLHSYMGRIFSNNSATGKRYSHSVPIAGNETVRSVGPWGTYRSDMFHLTSSSYTRGYVIAPKLPNLFQYTDLVARTGYVRTVFPAFKADETLLCRAEAYIMQGKYDEATADLALWMSTHTSSTVTLTRALVNSFYSGILYYTPYDLTVKKKLTPEVPVVSAEQENFLHCLLHMRRIETLYEGLRWFDIKRFGIVIQRKHVDAYNAVTVSDSLTINDHRRAIQLPISVISAGMTPNPR